MFGWIVSNIDVDDVNCSFIGSSDKIKIEDFYFIRKHNNRFANDTLFCETDKYFVIIDGIVLNKNELEEQYNKKFCDIVVDLYEKEDSLLPNSLRGPFSGLIFEKETKKCFAFANHTGDSGVFYFFDEKLIISNNFRWITEILKQRDIKYFLDENAVKYMCTFGFMLDNTTFVDKVKRIMPGEGITYESDNLNRGLYHEIDNYSTIDWSEQDIIERLDILFRQAIKREFEKDREYGYTSVVDLSGGLDSRVINYVAKAMGYTNILNVSFSQTFSDEYKAMIALSRDLGFKLFHYPLDNATHLYDIDKIVARNYGLSFYAGAGAIMSIMENINLNIYGLEHGGTLGEMATGVFPGDGYDKHIPPTFEKGMPFSRAFDLSILDTKILEKYNNLELFTIVGRGMLGGANNHLIRRHFTGFTMPFGDIDFYDFFLSIPVSIRGKGKILQKWVLQKYPEAFDVIEDKLMCKPNASNFTKKIMLFRRKVKGKLVQYFGNHLPKLMANNMNPVEYWYTHNENLRDFIEEYYSDNIYRLNNYPASKKMVDILFNSNNINEKLISLTVLSVMKQFM